MDEKHGGCAVSRGHHFAKQVKITDNTLHRLCAHVPNGVDIDMGNERQRELEIHLRHKFAGDGDYIEFHLLAVWFQPPHKELRGYQIAIVRVEIVRVVVDRGFKSTAGNKLQGVTRRKILFGERFPEQIRRTTLKFHYRDVVHGSLSGDKTHPLKHRVIDQYLVFVFVFFSHNRTN